MVAGGAPACVPCYGVRRLWWEIPEIPEIPERPMSRSQVTTTRPARGAGVGRRDAQWTEVLDRLRAGGRCLAWTDLGLLTIVAEKFTPSSTESGVPSLITSRG